MFRFKKEYANQTIVLSNGLLINAENCKTAVAQAALKSSPSFAYMLEEVEEPSASTATEPPVTGGGGAGDPRPKKTRTRKA